MISFSVTYRVVSSPELIPVMFFVYKEGNTWSYSYLISSQTVILYINFTFFVLDFTPYVNFTTDF